MAHLRRAEALQILETRHFKILIFHSSEKETLKMNM